MTNYIVLKRFQSPVVGWEIVGHAEAGNPHTARKSVDPTDGEYLAVPIRNATFISGTTITPEPKAVSVEVDASTYLGQQQELEVVREDGEGNHTPEPEPLVAA